VGDCRHSLWHFWCADVTPAQTHARDFSAIHARSSNAGDDHFIVNQSTVLRYMPSSGIVASGFGDGAVTVTYRGVHQNVVSFPRIVDLTHGTSRSAPYTRNSDAQSLSDTWHANDYNNATGNNFILSNISTAFTLPSGFDVGLPKLLGPNQTRPAHALPRRYKLRLLTLDRAYIDLIYLSLSGPETTSRLLF
jgi:hypothetical protein